jgi:hypothetical protein
LCEIGRLTRDSYIVGQVVGSAERQDTDRDGKRILFIPASCSAVDRFAEGTVAAGND